jgi:hypothetical protein
MTQKHPFKGKPNSLVSKHHKPKKAEYNPETAEYRRPKKAKGPSLDWLINQLLEGKQR